jgi:hypothetical protein
VEAATAPSRWDVARKRGDSAVKNDLNSNEKLIAKLIKYGYLFPIWRKRD